MMLRTRLTPADFVTPLPSPVQVTPTGADWLHEIKHDGFRLMVRRDGARVRLFTRNGYDWALPGDCRGCGRGRAAGRVLS
jgi:ATP-dependent DNA ligase